MKTKFLTSALCFLLLLNTPNLATAQGYIPIEHHHHHHRDWGGRAAAFVAGEVVGAAIAITGDNGGNDSGIYRATATAIYCCHAAANHAATISAEHLSKSISTGDAGSATSSLSVATAR